MQQRVKAVFLDRDGVLNYERDFLYKIEDFKFIDGAIDALLYLQSKKYILFIITNQSGIGRGYYSEQDFKTLTKWMLKELLKNKIKISKVCYCPHINEDNCNCRKPKTGMIDNIMTSWNIDIENSWLIGDKNSDIQCALNIGIQNTIQVKSGHEFNVENSKANFVLNSIKDINKII